MRTAITTVEVAAHLAAWSAFVAGVMADGPNLLLGGATVALMALAAWDVWRLTA